MMDNKHTTTTTTTTPTTTTTTTTPTPTMAVVDTRVVKSMYTPNLISALFLAWLTPLLKLGRQKPLEYEVSSNNHVLLLLLLL
jgi:hypothetical protein